MRDQLRRLASSALPARKNLDDGGTSLTALRAAAAELLLATAAEVALDQLHLRSDRSSRSSAPKALSWAPLLVAPLAAAAHVEHARRPREETSLALQVLNTATLAIGGALLIYELVDPQRETRRLGPLSLASAGVLGFAIDAQEREVHRAERDLRRRADVVERLVPRRKARLDRVVVHV
jgi:hypothetical protein